MIRSDSLESEVSVTERECPGRECPATGGGDRRWDAMMVESENNEVQSRFKRFSCH